MEDKETRCILGFDSDKVNTKDSLSHLCEISNPHVLLGEVTLGDHKVAYCRGHTFLTSEELKKRDPDYEDKGRKINEEGILLTLHGSPSCYGCAYNKETQKR